eukprot:6178958-Pleurochrysis_carterae.AAC.1
MVPVFVAATCSHPLSLFHTHSHPHSPTLLSHSFTLLVWRVGQAGRCADGGVLRAGLRRGAALPHRQPDE